MRNYLLFFTMLIIIVVVSGCASDDDGGEINGIENVNPKIEVIRTFAGNLEKLISKTDRYCIKELKVVGEINGSDIRVLRDMMGSMDNEDRARGVLEYLDLSDARIVSGGKPYAGSHTISYLYTEDDIVGDYMFGTSYSIDPATGKEYVITLKKIILPKHTISISGEHVFEQCYKLETIDIPNSVKNISCDFSDLKELKSIVIPNSVKTMMHCHLEETEKLTSIYFKSKVCPDFGYPVFGDGYRWLPDITVYVPFGCENSYRKFFRDNKIVEIDMSKI
ncbi:leucine-rich repeat protein [Xylanibacter caecicola]|uniref:leucine-rich repeat protein n=1 Tax=Xylanibacter caecicola TaxID=2736294 RepID=UPI00258EC4E9|nr:leucine-rich repeat protein [Xylanibacter caecicola]